MSNNYCVCCENNQIKNPDVSYFRFPKDLTRCRTWIKSCRLDVEKYSTEYCYKRYRICSAHFEERMFSSMQKNRLKKTASPTLYLNLGKRTKSEHLLENVTPFKSEGYEGTCSTTSNVSCQTPEQLSASTPRLRSKLRNLQRPCTPKYSEKKHDTTVEDVVQFCSTHLSETATNFMRTQISLSNTSPHGYCYSKDFKQFALTIYFLGPQAYKFLAKTFKLPSRRTLYGITRQWNFEAGFNSNILSIIRTKVDLLQESARSCVLCIDEMSLKSHLFYNLSKDEIIGFHHTMKTMCKPADRVLVVMARGITANWKQPVAYFFINGSCSGEELKNIIFTSVIELDKLGLNVLGIISDQGSNFIKFCSNCNITAEKPYFSVNNKKIYYMFDIPHLLKSTRNNLLKYKMKIAEVGETDGQFLKTFYEKDKQQSFRLAPKLTDANIYPTTFQKMEVKFAAQILSNSVATALHTYISFGALPLSATATADFIDKFNKLFDIFNSSSSSNKKGFTGALEDIQFLEDMMSLLSSITASDEGNKNITNEIKFIKGWKQSIAALLGIWEVLQSQGVQCLYTRRLNQDCLDNYFGKIRLQSGSCRNPTPIQFSTAFKKLFCMNYFEHSDGAKCIEDLDNILVSLTSENVMKYETVFTNLSIYNSLTTDTKDYRNLSLPEKNAFVYVYRYFLKKCLAKHHCDVCVSYANTENVFCHFKAYDTAERVFEALLMPPKCFHDLVARFEVTFCNIFYKEATNKNVGKKIKMQLQQINMCHPCKEFPSDYFLCLFVRVRIFYTLKFLNRNMKNCKDKKSYKLEILQHL